MIQEVKLTERTPEAKADYWRKNCIEVVRKLKTATEQINSLTVDLNSMKAQRDRAQKEAKNLGGKLTSAESNGKENARLAELFRSHLDDRASEFFDDNEWEQQARQITWNGIDAEASRTEHCMAEGIDE